jgi:diketogulonate reductase-like aldo/keto reductase
MLERRFGPLEARLPVIGQGTWKQEHDTRSDAVAALRAGLDLGMRHIDTAELYGSGRVEAIVGEAIAGRRHEVFLVSKVIPSNASRRGTITACERSLRALGTDYLDCYLLHWPGSHPLEATISAFEELQAAGKIRSYGVSNFDEDELALAVRLAGPGKIACNQVLYNLGERSIEHAVLPYCRQHGIAVVGYTPLERTNFSRAPLLQAIAARHGATSRQVALAFLTRHPEVFTIPKSSNPEHTAENAAAATLELSSSDLAELERAYPLGRRRPGVPMI